MTSRHTDHCRSRARGYDILRILLHTGIASALALSCQRSDAPANSMITADSAQVLFTRACSSCHGTAGEGTRLGPNLKSGKWQHTDGTPRSIARVIERGIAEPRNFASPMPAGGGAVLTKEEIRGLAQYVAGLSALLRSE